MAKTKALISCEVSAQLLICAFVFAYAISRFSHDAAQIRIICLYVKEILVIKYSKAF